MKQRQRYYVLNMWENKIEVYTTSFVPYRTDSTGRERFYSNCTLCIYSGSIPVDASYRRYNRGHWQVENVRTGNQIHIPYYGERSTYKFKILTRSEVIKLLKSKQQQPA